MATLFAAVVAGLLVTAPPAPLFARVCVSVEKPPTLNDVKRDAQLRSEGLKSIEQTTAIFLGEALSSSRTSATFKVTRVWQGDLTTPLTLLGPTEVLHDGSERWTSDIASDFKIGASYLVFAHGPSLAKARPSACSTVLASKAGEEIRILDFLKKSYPPKK